MQAPMQSTGLRVRQQLRCHPPRSGTLRAIRAVPTSTNQAFVVEQTDETWAAFGAKFAGEWEGVSVSYAADGAPQPLPEHYVPGAYRDWGVEIRDWQTQCSCTTGDGRQLSVVLRRLMPTVGCEADAVAFTQDATTAIAGGGEAPALAYLPDGSYTTGPASFDLVNASKLRFEACFAGPGLSTEGILSNGGGAAAPAGNEEGPGPAAAQPPRYRLKVAQNLARNWADGSWRVASVELHRERYDGPHTGRQELAGCGGGQPTISGLQPVPEEQLRGSWAVEGGVVLVADGGALRPAAAGGARGAAPIGAEGAVLTRLPLGAWSAVRADGSGNFWIESGALAEGGVRQVAARSYEGGAVKEVSLGVERLAE